MNRATKAAVDVGIVAVDVANVCRDTTLPARFGLDRLDLVLDAWSRQIYEHAEVYPVVDRTLMAELSRVERRRVKASCARQEMWVRRRGADDLLLDLAEELGGCVLSRDRFLDHRRKRAGWIKERFFSWSVDAAGVRVGLRPSRNTQRFDVSRREEQKLAASRGIVDLRDPSMRRRWVCVSAAPCETRTANPVFLRVLPVLQEGTPHCPGCGHALADRGERPWQAEVKLIADEAELGRFTIEQDDPIEFGRAILPNSPELDRRGRRGQFSDLGRVHVNLRLDRGQLLASPADDGHRVWVQRWDASERRFERRIELHPRDGFTPIGLRDKLLIGSRLELHRSGRSVAEAETLGLPGSEEPWQAMKTTK